MAFSALIKVCFGDIDNAGIVYYPRFMHYFHVALEEFFSEEIGVEYARVIEKYRMGFPTVHLEADFRRRLRFGDQIALEVWVREMGSTSITWGYLGYKKGEKDSVVVEGHNVTVCVDMDSFEKKQIPEWFRKELETYQKRCAC
jgi:4-hydroxybenzoyl-CoA thioesterase